MGVFFFHKMKTNKTVDADESQTPHDTKGDMLPADKSC